MIHFHFRIQIATSAPAPYPKVSAATNRLTASQVLFNLKRTNGSLAVEWSTLNLIRGYEPRSTTDTSIEVRDTNYIETLGLVPGTNTLDFQLDVPDDTSVQRLDVFPDSGLEWISEPPGKLALSVSAVRPARVGRTFKVGYGVNLVSGHDLENLSIEAGSLNPAVRSVGAPTRHVERLGRSVAGSFAFRASRAGRFRLRIHVKSGTTRPTKIFRVQVLPKH